MTPLPPHVRGEIERAIAAWRQGSAYSTIDGLDGPAHGRHCATLLEHVDEQAQQLVDARCALRELVDALALDDKPRRVAIRRACERLEEWGMPASWRPPHG